LGCRNRSASRHGTGRCKRGLTGVIHYEALGQVEQFIRTPRWLPRDPVVRQHPGNHPLLGAAQRLHGSARLQVGGGRKCLHDQDHIFPVQNAGDLVGDGGSDLPETRGRKICEEGGGKTASEVGKCVAVEEEERCPAMKMAEQVEGLGQRQLFLVARFPVCCARCLSF